MARKPEKEVVLSAYDKYVSLGFVYDFSTKEYSPGDTMLTINIEECIPEYKIKVKSKEDLSLLKNSEPIKNTPWTQDFDATKFSDCILLQGEKICERKGNVEPQMKLGVVSSAYYKSYIDMLICFNDQIEERAIEDLEKYIKSLTRMKSSGSNFQNKEQDTDFNRCQSSITIVFIPSSISHTFSNGYIYVKGKRTPVSSIKHGLGEFCNYLVCSEISKFPVCCKVKYPLCTTQDSYASVVKNKYPINAQDEMPAVHPSIDQSCCIGGRLSDSVPHMKRSQRIELPVAHNTRSKAKVIGTNGTPFSQLNDVAMKELEKSKSIPDRTHACRPRTEKTLSGKAVDKRGEQQLIGCHVSDRKPLHHKNSEVLNTSQLPQDDASTNYSNKDVCRQSSQNLTKPECVELKMYVSEKCTRGDELRSNNSTVHNSAIEKQFQEKHNIPHSSHVAGDINNSEKHESLIEKSQSKFELKTVIPQIMFDKSNLFEVNKSNAESSSTLIMPVKELEVCGVMRKFYGATPKAEGKTIILLGASGSGKTTLVNFIANYFHGNKRAAGKLVQVVKNSNDFQGHTRQITGYTFCVSEDDSPLTIIDTPGLNDSSGAEVYDHVQSLKTFLANADSQNLKIHAIGFVAQAHIVRLTSSERLIMDYISSLFGKEIGKHVISFVTFSDNQETPPIVEAINNYGMNCSVFLKFNNSALSSNNEEEIDELDRIYWRIGCKSLKKCIKLLEMLPRLSFKSLMDEIYVTQFLEVAEKKLRTEIMDFVDHYRRNKGFTKKVLDNGERVWTLAEAVKELRCINASQCSTIDNILLSHVEGICNVKNSCLSSKECIKLLSLSPSRPLLKAGLAIISSIAPLYNSVKQICDQSQNLRQKNQTPDVLFCHICEKDHVLRRLEQRRGWVVTNKRIAYKCSECDCAGDLHGEKGNEHENHKIAESHGFTPDKMLHHTRNSIKKVLHDLCLPEHKIHENLYINWLRLFAKQEAQQFCIDLLNIS